MSLILEALRKSEAQRRLGQTPDLMSPSPNLGGPGRRGIPAWPWFLAGLVLVAGTAWWFGRQTPFSPALAPAGSAQTERSSSTDSADRAAETRAASPPPTASPPDVPAGPPVAVLRPEQASPTTSESEPAVPDTRGPAASAPAPSPPAPAPISASASPEVTANVADGPATAADLAHLRARLESVARRQVASETSAAAADETLTPTPWAQEAAEPIRRFEELGAREREGLPELKLSLHVFADDPAGRFVVLGGRRLGEGAMIGPRARIAEIRRDGVVIEIDGRPVLVGRP